MSEVETRLADRVDAWLQVCGACDAGMYECTHPNEDPRTMIGDLWDEVTRLRDQLARVRTDTIEQCAKAAKEAAHDPVVPPYTHGAAWIQGFITGAQRIVAAVRGVSHEH